MPHAFFPTPIGVCGIAWTERGVSGFALPSVEPGHFGEEGDDQTDRPPQDITAIMGRVVAHLGGEAEDFSDVRYDFGVITPFQREVYETALRVKAGDVRTYGWIAMETGRTTQASRAVGGALGSNPWPLLVPCHRFVGANEKMTGFSSPGGVAMKRKLLAIEGAELIAED